MSTTENSALFVRNSNLTTANRMSEKHHTTSQLTLADSISAERSLVEERHAPIAACSLRVVQTLTLIYSHVTCAGDRVSITDTAHGGFHSIDGHKRLEKGKKVA